MNKILLSCLTAALLSGPAFAQSTIRKQLTFFSGSLTAELSLDPVEKSGDEHFMNVRWLEGQTPIASDRDIPFEVTLWMEMDGVKHTSAPTEVKRLSDGSYRVSNMYFFMPGQWDIEIKTFGFLGWEDAQSWPVTWDESMSVCTSPP